MYPQIFSVPGKRTRSLARTKHARSEKIKNKKIKSNQCWYLVVFGSKSVLLGVLLIKNLPSKCISQIRLDINKIKKKKQRNSVEEDEERRRRGRRFNGWQKARETFTMERLVTTRRGQSREKRWEAWVSFRAKGRAERWDERNEEHAWELRTCAWFIDG